MVQVYQDKQEGEECLKTKVLKDCGYLDGSNDIVTLYKLPF